MTTIRVEGTWNSSADVFGNGCASNPNDISACTGHAIALDDEGHRRAALESIDASLARHADDPYLLMERATIFERASDRVRALTDARHAARAGVGSALAGYAGMLVRMGYPRAAIPYAIRAVIRHPELPQYADTLALALHLAVQPHDEPAPP